MKLPALFILAATTFASAISPALGEEPTPAEKTVAKTAEQARLSRMEADFNAISSALKAYKLNGGSYPTEEQGLKSMVDRPTTSPIPKRWVKIMTAVPKDAWGRDYRYAVRVKDGKKEYLLLCDGPSAEDKKDDIEHVVESEKQK